jgi:uncharacterized protein
MIALHRQVRVPLPLEQAWPLLTDLPKVARCMPGASLDDVVDGEYRGGLSTRIGPISANYLGTAVFREQDEVAHRAVIEAQGREEKGSGSATALVTIHLKPAGDETLLDVSTELAISGRAAQFGRSLLAEVSNSILDEFVRRLEALISTDEGASASGSAADSTPRAAAGRAAADDTARRSPAEPEQALDLLATVVVPLARRAAAPACAAVVAGALGLLIGRRSRAARNAATIPLTYVLPYPGEVPADLLGR